MIRQIILLIFFNCCFLKGESQTKIFLKYDAENPKEKYSFKNSGDTAFVKLSYSIDMGNRYGFKYEAKLNVPDQFYEIYLNDKLTESYFINDHLLDSIHTQYYPAGRTLTTYSKGVKHGPFRQYSTNNILIGTGEHRMDELYLYTVYYENGVVARRSFSLPKSAAIHAQGYDKNGAIVELTNYSNGQPLLSSEEKYKNGTLDGPQKLTYKDYYFEMIYEMNKLIKWTLYNSKEKGHRRQLKPFLYTFSLKAL